MDIAVRYSEYEPIEFVMQFKNIFKWVWIDTPGKLPINKEIINNLKGFKTCLVCPERWGRKNDIKTYKNYIKKNNFELTAVMTSKKTAKLWL